MDHTTGYSNTFIRTAPDCPVQQSEIPLAKAGKKPAHLIQYELLMAHPYTYDHAMLTFELYIFRNGIPPEVLETERAELWDALFSKGHPCLRASALTKRYGFGAHYDAAGKIALYPMESEAYRAFLQDPGVKVLYGMRTKR